MRYIDLFSGAGGWSCGLDLAGFTHVASYDINPPACETARSNLKEGSVEVADLRKADLSSHAGIDLVVGSPPCQGFSNEGYKQKNDPRNSLVEVFLDLIERLKPRTFLFENVPGFQRLYKGSYYHRLRDRLTQLDYRWQDMLVDASLHGVPQRRIRFFVVASKDFAPSSPPEPSHASDVVSLFLPRVLSLWEAISDLPEVGTGERIGRFEYDRPASTPYQQWARAGSPCVENHTTQRHSERVLEKIRAVLPGEGMRTLVERYEENRVHYEGGYRRALKDAPSYTAYWTRGMTSIHPEQDRFLSPRECARIQSFPDRYVFRGSTIENYTQICNAVPPLLAYAFGRLLSDKLLGRTLPDAAQLFTEAERMNRAVGAQKRG